MLDEFIHQPRIADFSVEVALRDETGAQTVGTVSVSGFGHEPII